MNFVDQINTLLVQAEMHAVQMAGCPAHTQSDFVDTLSDVQADAQNCYLRIQFLFPGMDIYRWRLLLLLHYQRKMLISLLSVDRKKLSPQLLTTLERTVVRTEHSFILISQLVRKRMQAHALQQPQKAILDEYFLKIPFDEPPFYIDKPQI